MSADVQASPHQVYRRRTEVIATDLEDELVLLDPGTVEMYSLNTVGRLVWLSLPDSLAGIVGKVTESFDVSAEQALSDVQELLGTLSGMNLVELQGP
jgi:Coenzyme PQQ synthesis protein D (PqqD)